MWPLGLLLAFLLANISLHEKCIEIQQKSNGHGKSDKFLFQTFWRHLSVQLLLIHPMYAGCYSDFRYIALLYGLMKYSIEIIRYAIYCFIVCLWLHLDRLFSEVSFQRTVVLMGVHGCRAKKILLHRIFFIFSMFHHQDVLYNIFHFHGPLLTLQGR